MTTVQDGQCGLCSHFGQDHGKQGELVEIRKSHAAPADLVEECDHPKHVSLHLKVTAISGCDGFQPVSA